MAGKRQIIFCQVVLTFEALCNCLEKLENMASTNDAYCREEAQYLNPAYSAAVNGWCVA